MKGTGSRSQVDKNTMDEFSVTLARQPILATDRSVFGYELLYRGSRLDSAAATAQSARVLCEALGNLGVERVVGNAHAFVNFDQELLETDFPTLLPPGQGVVELLETVEPNPRVFETLNQLRRRGIGVAADDFMFQANAVPFLPHVDYVKVDILLAADELAEIAKQLREYPVLLIAEKVETHEQAARCQQLGFNFLQGYFFARPEPMQARSIGSTQVAIVSLIAELNNPDSEAVQLAEKICTDLALTHQILKLANSAAFRRQRAVGSIADAVILLGQDVIRQWASLLLLTRLEDRKSPALLLIALIRGRMCQTLGAAQVGLGSNELFTVGLLSVLDALLDRPMSAVASELPLEQSLCDALCGHPSSVLGDVLRRAIAYESGDWVALGALTAEERKNAMVAYTNATHFAHSTLGR